ncbi:hypothetical protein MNV49_005994 [Pseudohyphozyma bogoriensis]|nr:hypothetical protein MNV49_005994 [Pseudohyphozyma bogoriensis]
MNHHFKRWSYLSGVFLETGSTETVALLGSFGFGLLNWVFAYPAFFTIDTFGRRSLLLFTFPFLSLTMLIAGLGFVIPQDTNPKGQLACVITGLYLFTCFYSPGMGPVPFSYSAEV